MKTILLRFLCTFFCAISSPFLLSAQSNDLFKTSIVADSKLLIAGTSNVTDFECVYEGTFSPDTLIHTLRFNDGDFSINGDSLELVIDDFDCGKRGINRDFRKTLKSAEFPTIKIMPLGFSDTDSLLNKMGVSISLAGVTNNYTLNFESSSPSMDIFRVKGMQQLNMTDFDISPPRTLLGLIKVDNELSISFEVFLKHQ